MNKLQIFDNPEFGEIRTYVEPDGTVLFCGSDVAASLGYTNPRFAVRKYCRGGSKRSGIDSANRARNMTFVPEGDVYRLIVEAERQSQSKEIREKAERFASLVFDEILPSVRKEGSYITDRADPAALRRKADELEDMATLNETARLLLPIYEQAGMKPAFQALAMKQIYRKAGLELPFDDLRADRELYDLRGVAKRAGIYSTAGKPHELAAGAIIRMIDVPDGEKELVQFERNGHMGTAYQYTAWVVDKVQEWLIENDCPAEIIAKRGGKQVAYKVKYQTKSVKV